MTSRCPLRCVFCSRETLRGEGEDLPLELFQRLLPALQDSEVLRLNYSGESGNYPELLEAIALAKTTDAQVEMVTALVSMPIEVVQRLGATGIDRVTVSCHSLDPERFARIYGAGSLAQFERRLALLEAPRGLNASAGISVDFAMVVMRENLSEIPSVAAFAARHGAPALSLHPVIRRPGVPYVGLDELESDGSLNAAFQQAMDAQIEEAREQSPNLDVSVARPSRSEGHPTWCEQNPFETVHVLANGDVVPCEVLDRRVLGNVRSSGLATIWNGKAYADFRERYSQGSIDACRQCIFRQPVARVGPVTATWGWYPRDSSGALWSRVKCAFQCESGQGNFVVIRGLLPHSGRSGGKNRLTVFCDGQPVATTVNSSAHPIEFALTLPLTEGVAVTYFTAVVDHGLSPWRAGLGGDSRTLGFSLYDTALTDIPPPVTKAEKTTSIRRSKCGLQEQAASLLVSALDWRWSRLSAACLPVRPKRSFDPDLSVVVPERGNPRMLNECLTALDRALVRARVKVQVIAVVNGVDLTSNYLEVSRRFANYKFVFSRQPLGFSAAVLKGLQHVKSGWTYLLNSDALLEENAMAEVIAHRDSDVFSIASRIVPQSAGKATETNHTAIQMLDGLANLIELEYPADTVVVEHAYGGGGASLFQTELLRKLALRTKWYDPFYWEDVEWGAIARAIGLRCLFAPASRVQHMGGATVSRFYHPAEIARIFERNRIQFQLRCLPQADLGVVRERIADAPWKTLQELLHPARIADSAAVRAGMRDRC